MRVVASLQFLKKLKKMPKLRRAKVDAQIVRLQKTPDLGEEKKQDLAGVFVHKFKVNRQQLLLSYRIVGDELQLITIGTHENYYRDLKRYLK